MDGFTSIGTVLNTLLYSFIGIVMFWLWFLILDKVTPHDCLWTEIVKEKNVAVGIVVGAMFLGIATIIASAIH
jgi:uncharacterized membrane protein YjfL (UPF0719 family)